MEAIEQIEDELYAISLKVLALTSILSSIDVISDFGQGYLLYQNPKLRAYGLLTIAINWIPGIIASIHLISYQRHQLGLKKTLLYCREFVFITY